MITEIVSRYSSGEKKIEHLYANNILFMVKRYYIDGKIESIEDIKNGVWHGTIKKYSKHGHLDQETIFNNGKAILLRKFYPNSDKIYEITQYDDGYGTGLDVFFNDSFIQTINRTNGVVSGRCEIFDVNKNTQALIANYANSIIEGEMIYPRSLYQLFL
jgi:antitoxin component YwqK of YwqJK toxin-antitoxin module